MPENILLWVTKLIHPRLPSETIFSHLMKWTTCVLVRNPSTSRQKNTGSRLSYESSVEITLFFLVLSLDSLSKILTEVDLFQEWKNKSINSPRPRLWRAAARLLQEGAGLAGHQEEPLNGSGWMCLLCAYQFFLTWCDRLNCDLQRDCCLIQGTCKYVSLCGKGDSHCRLSQACSSADINIGGLS